MYMTRKPYDAGKLTALLLFLPPALLLFTLFVVMPIGEAAWYSGFNWNGFGTPKNWIGWDNYRFVFDNKAFGTAFKNNLLIIVVSLLVQLPLALSLALILARAFKGAVMLRMLFFMPYILAEIATGLIFSFVYDGDFGLLAAIYRQFGAQAPHLLASPDTSMLAILLVIVWKYFGFHMMLFIAALQGMDKNLVEAARVDGANRWQILRHIIIPAASDHQTLDLFCHCRLVATVRPDHAADARRTGGFLAYDGLVPLQFRCDADAGRLWQRGRGDPVRNLRDFRLQL